MANRIVTFRLYDDLIDWLDERARQTRMNRTGVLVQLIIRAKKEMEDGRDREAAGQAKEEA